MTGEENNQSQSKWDEKKKKKNRRPTKQRKNSHAEENSNSSKKNFNQNVKSNHQDVSNPESLVLRKQVDPETTKYFSEIANVLEGGEVDYEERSVICGNALEEAKGKELELATDYILSHAMQTLLDGCDVDHLCSFLRSCGQDFPLIAVDRSGSHVAETALRALTMHIQDESTLSIIEETLTKICQVMVAKPVDVMCNPHGSHVLRSLLCICKGVPVDFSEEFHVTKSSATLAGRLNTKVGQTGEKNLQHTQHGFPDLLIFLVEEMLKYGRQDIGTLRVDQYSSLVLQTALKLLAGDDLALMRIIPLLLGSREENIKEGNMIDKSAVPGIMISIKDNAFSHLMEVILEVAPDTLYDEIFTKFFRNYMFKISSDHCGSFVMQALVSSVKCEDQIDLILEELGDKFKDLVENGKTGVIASLLAACQRLHKHERKCGQALVNAVCSTTESPNSIVPRLLFLESYIWSEDKPNWKWPKGDRMHVLGCLMLQTVFKYPTEFIQPYVTSILAMEADQILETAKSPGGGRVIESFLTSGASAKLKRKMIARLRGHFGELVMHPSGSFTIEKCFDASSPSLKETIVSELLEVRSELYKTRQGPYLSRKLDIDGYASRPEQWKSRQESKQNSYKDFYDTFGSGSNKPKPESPKRKRVHSEPANSGPVQLKGVKNMRKEMDEFLANPNMEVSMAKLGFSGKHSRDKEEERGSNKFAKVGVDDGGSGKSKSKEKKSKKRKDLET